MGTRNLTMVIYKKKTVISQYGQYDGYPSYTGKAILEFMLNKEKVNKLKEQLDGGHVTLMTEKDAESRFGTNWCKESLLDSTAGCEVLNEICKGGHHWYLLDSTVFAHDSLFCEWGWVINLDTMSLEVYKGFNFTPLEKGERFRCFNKLCRTNKYKPIKYIMSILDVKVSGFETPNEYIDNIIKAIEKKI